MILIYGKTLLPPIQSQVGFMRVEGEGNGKGFFKLTKG